MTTRTHLDFEGTSLRRILALAIVVLVAAMASMVALADPSGAGEGIIRDIGTLPSGTSMDTKTGPEIPVLRMLVDPALNLGLTLGSASDGASTLFIYDLKGLRTVGQVKEPEPGFYFGLNPQNAALDPLHHRVYFPPGGGGTESGSCPIGPSQAMSIRVFDISERTWSTLKVPCTGTSAASSATEGGADQLRIQGLYYFAPENKLYAVGAPQAEWAVRSGAHNQDTNGQTLLLRQMDAATGRLDWETDLRPAGCERLIETGSQVAFVGRYGNQVHTYCYGKALTGTGSPGYAIRVDLVEGRPKVKDGADEIRSNPTLPGDLFPMIDPGSGRILLLTAGSTNGNAVWAYDGQNERFFGVIASGIVGNTENGMTIYAGLNTQTGRTYLLTGETVLVADARHVPLPAGLSYKALPGLKNQGSGPFIAVAPSLNRIFVPVKGRGFAVFEDSIPEPDDPPAADPDRGTADIPEVIGKTGSAYSAASAAYGAHALLAGGLSRVVNNVDPICSTFLAFLETDNQGRCVGDQVFTTGNRELFLAASQVALGSETGVSSEATGGAFANADNASDSDLKRLGTCESDLVAERGGGDSAGLIRAFCVGTPLKVFAHGSRGADRRGFPIRRSECEDFEDKASDDAQTPGNEGLPTSTVGASEVTCDNANHTGTARSAANSFAYPDASQPLVSVARVESSTTNTLLAEGMKTQVTAIARGITVGPFNIGEVHSQVTTVARGRTGTAKATLTRSISDMSGPGIACHICSPDQVTTAINRFFGSRVRASVPSHSLLESPKGYQAVVLKDPALRDSERAANDDDTFAITGLNIVFFNDGQQGRNRLVFQLAGVQAESRYGIFLLPEDVSSGSDFTDALDTGEELDHIEGLGNLGGGSTTIERIIRVVKKVVTAPAVFVRDALSLVVTNPREFGLLFMMWSLLASPAYLAIRRRALAGIFSR